ncbi:MAG TPA: hypothetical protein VK473_12635 [Terriglobales bacterium]|nr:hypothetical protein [Terriglobales bacterium]
MSSKKTRTHLTSTGLFMEGDYPSYGDYLGFVWLISLVEIVNLLYPELTFDLKRL